MSLKKVAKGLFLPILFFAGGLSASAQGSSIPTGKTTDRLDWNESFEGSTGSSGQEMELDSSATIHFGRFSAGAGIPVYFNRAILANGVTTSEGVGDFSVTLGATWNHTILNYATALTGSAPTGNSSKGFSTGHATFDWNNRIDHDFDIFSPFLGAGVANSVTDTRYFHRPFTSYGYLAHGEAGVDIDLTHSFTLTVSGYKIAPWGTQTIISRNVAKGGVGSGGSHGRVFEVNHSTTGPASLNYDDGFTAGLSYSPKPYLNLDLGFTRSMSFAYNTFSWGIEVNMSQLISRENPAHSGRK
jgi:hypothetical protein